MKKALATVLVSVLAFASVAEAKHKTMEELNLTPEQHEEAERIFARTQEKMEDLRKQEREIKEQIRHLYEENMEEFEKILTPEQKENLQKFKKDRERKMQKHKMRGMHDVKSGEKNGPKMRKTRPEKENAGGGFAEE